MREAFTLIELVVVVVIIGLLTMVSVPLYRSYVASAMFTAGRRELGPVARKAVTSLATRGTCIPSDGKDVVTVDPTATGILASYKFMNASVVSPDRDGCMVAGYFRSVAQGGHAVLDGKIVRIHYVTSTAKGGNPGPIVAAECYTNVAASALGRVEGDQGCSYDQAWVNEP